MHEPSAFRYCPPSLLAVTRSGLSVSREDLSGALDELLDTRNAMTRTLLGPAPA